MKERLISFYKNELGEPSIAIIRLHNRRIIVNKIGGSILLSTASVCVDPSKPASTHNVIRNSIRVTQISFSLEAMEAISMVMSYMGIFKPERIESKEDDNKIKVKCDVCGHIWGENLDKIDENVEIIKCPHCKQDAYYLIVDE